MYLHGKAVALKLYICDVEKFRSRPDALYVVFRVSEFERNLIFQLRYNLIASVD